MILIPRLKMHANKELLNENEIKLKRKQHASLLRNVRKIHRYTGIVLMFFFLWLAVTGIILGWKKHSNGLILPKTQKGNTTSLSEWLPLDSLSHIAAKSVGNDVSDIDRMDVRPQKGIVKVLFKDGYHGLQIDGSSGEILQYQARYSDLVEDIHDGSIADDFFNLPNGIFKLFYTSVMGLALMTFCITGFWLWYGPKVMRRH